jgi:hypothetical protein
LEQIFPLLFPQRKPPINMGVEFFVDSRLLSFITHRPLQGGHNFNRAKNAASAGRFLSAAGRGSAAPRSDQPSSQFPKLSSLASNNPTHPPAQAGLPLIGLIGNPHQLLQPAFRILSAAFPLNASL